MLKTVSSITNALGAMNYKGTWNANTNTPTLVSGAGAKGDYYVVSVAGTTTLDGISNWGVGDWAAFNGTTWQRLEGGADLNGVNLTVSGTSILTGNVTFNNNLVQDTADKGINFTANTPAAGMTSQLLNLYEEGTWTPVPTATIPGVTPPTFASTSGTYTRIGRQVYVTYNILFGVNGTGAGVIKVDGLPFALAQRGFGIGVESDVVGFGIYSNGIAATTSTYLETLAGTYPGGTAYRLQGDFSYIV